MKRVIFTTVLGLLFCFGLSAQDKDEKELAEFKIAFQKVGDAMLLSCENGCNWNELTFEVAAGESFLVYQRGGQTPEYNEDGTVKLEKKTDYAFTVQPTDSGFDLMGIKGTDWNYKSIALREGETYYINQNGDCD